MKNDTIKYETYVDSEYTSIHRIAMKIPPRSVVLDVGCATGYLGKLLRPKECILYGIEGNPDAARQARECYREVYVLDLENTQTLNGDSLRFDVIVFGDVLEHLRDPGRLLERTRSFLNPEGRIIVSLPNVANWSMRFHLLRGKFDYVRYGVLDETHLRFFNLDTGRRMIEEAGFEIVETDFTPGVDKLVPYRMLVQRFFKNYGWYRRLEYRLTKCRPGLFAHQMIFTARKAAG